MHSLLQTASNLKVKVISKSNGLNNFAELGYNAWREFDPCDGKQSRSSSKSTYVRTYCCSWPAQLRPLSAATAGLLETILAARNVTHTRARAHFTFTRCKPSAKYISYMYLSVHPAKQEVRFLTEILCTSPNIVFSILRKVKYQFFFKIKIQISFIKIKIIQVFILEFLSVFGLYFEIFNMTVITFNYIKNIIFLY